MKVSAAQQLDDLGERALIETIFRPRYERNSVDLFGDDCAIVCRGEAVGGDDTIVATTDPCPEPMASLLGYTDPYYRGWLLATINLSDLAAVGARPLGLLTSLILRNDMTVWQLLRLLDGIDDCCNTCNTRVIGGNIKEGSKTDLSATAIGLCQGGRFLSRLGCQLGDLIVVIGDLGLFWAGVLALQQGINIGEKEKRLLNNILTPLPKVHLGREIAERGLMTACLDNSDGLYPSLIQLAEANSVQMYVNLQPVVFPPESLYVSSMTGVDPMRFALGWGDWQLVGSCNQNNLNELMLVAQSHSIDVSVIGEVRAGNGVILHYAGRAAPMAPIDSQRFTKDSWFTAGLSSYIEKLTKGSIWEE